MWWDNDVSNHHSVTVMVCKTSFKCRAVSSCPVLPTIDQLNNRWSVIGKLLLWKSCTSCQLLLWHLIGTIHNVILKVHYFLMRLNLHSNYLFCFVDWILFKQGNVPEAITVYTYILSNYLLDIQNSPSCISKISGLLRAVSSRCQDFSELYLLRPLECS